MKETSNRRPLKVRGSKFAQNIASWLSKKNITPNQISISSTFFALACAVCLMFLSHVSGFGKFLLPILAALFIQCRLLCNLFDGMVAVEGGKTTASGELFNDIPDRIADPLILIAAGYAVSSISADWAVTAGWCAGILSIFTAYVRTLCSSIGAPTDFQGPMAKQHRMAVMTIACVITAFEGIIWVQGYMLFAALLIIIIGCIITIYRRVKFAYRYLENNNA
jgi:phosphatidylglycerophosphate synthase